MEAGIRFALTNEGMTTVLVGYSTFEHLEYAAAAAEKGPLPRAALDRLAALWREQGEDLGQRAVTGGGRNDGLTYALS